MTPEAALIRQYPALTEAPEEPAAPARSGKIEPLHIEHLLGISHVSAAQLVRVVPAPLRLGSLLDARLRVVEPIDVSFKAEAEQLEAHAPELDEFGFGESALEAITDLQHTVAELYFELEKNQARLGADLARIWASLQSKVERRPV